MLEHIREIDSTKWTGDRKNNIADYKGEPGVWILIGREKGSAGFVCLQVGQTITGIGEEIETDISCLKEKSFEPVEFEPVEKEYVNQFGETVFSYKEHTGRRKMLYKEIAENYDDLAFFCIAHGKGLQGGLLKTIEKYAAYKTFSRYWVNGRPFKTGKSAERIESIKEDCTKACEALFKEIKKNYQKADSLKEFLDRLAGGNIE